MSDTVSLLEATEEKIEELNEEYTELSLQRDLANNRISQLEGVKEAVEELPDDVDIEEILEDFLPAIDEELTTIEDVEEKIGSLQEEMREAISDIKNIQQRFNYLNSQRSVFQRAVENLSTDSTSDSPE